MRGAAETAAIAFDEARLHVLFSCLRETGRHLVGRMKLS